VVVVRHGVDTSVFRPGLEPPAELSDIPRPRVGYVGRINEVLDTTALLRIAESRSEWSLVLVGDYSFTDAEKRRRFDSLCRLSNVHRFDARPASEIPNWLGGLDAGLACYDTSSWAAFGQPIKIYEYLACGLPVIATNIDAVRELGDIVTAVSPDGDWVGAVESALARTDASDVARRLDFAARNSWDARVAQIEAELSAI
jgi:glycosyltransferase involved in cell wall biosynthesis